MTVDLFEIEDFGNRSQSHFCETTHLRETSTFAIAFCETKGNHLRETSTFAIAFSRFGGLG